MIKMSPVKYDAVTLQGGYDLSTPSLLLRPGAFRNGQNFEVATTGGYSRVGGYERYDGRPAPSDASYGIVQVESFSHTPSTGDTITQAVSGATGVVIYVGSNFMVVTKITGTFDETHSITTPGPVTIGTATTSTQAPTALQQAQYLNLAADVYRADIGAVPGSGAVLGVISTVLSGVDYVFAFRANTAASAVNLYKATTAGWVQVPFFYEISFTSADTPGHSGTIPSVGETLTRGGVTATVKRVCTQTGTWTGTGTGRLIISAPSGGNFTAGNATLSGGATLSLSGVQTAITLAVGGKFEFTEGNFFGQSTSLKIYGCDGVNRAFEFDGTTLAPISTGVTPTDAPKHIVVHKNFLMVSIQSSLFYSGVGDPFRWTAADGAGEIAAGDTITNFVVAPGNQTTATLVVTGRSNTFMLYGTSAATWNFVTYNTGVGSIDYTVQNMSDTYLFDNRGVFMLQTTLNFGNFESSALTRNIMAFIEEKRTKVAYSTVKHQKSQYRVFFNDGYALYMTIVNGKFIGGAPIYFPNAVYCAAENEQANGTEASFFGAASGGYVYHLDKGSSFDGENIDAYITLAYDFAGSPRLLKQRRHASLEMQGTNYASVDFGYAFGYSSTEIDQPTPTSYASAFQAMPPWDTFVWDSFTWDGVTLAPTEVDIVGTAENIQATISSSTDYMMPFTINSIIYHYTPRRGLR